MKSTSSWDLFGEALFDFWKGEKQAALKVYMQGDEADILPASLFFRAENAMTEVELMALKLCKGKVLDVGAAAGCHSIILSESHEVYPIDISAKAVEIMKAKGLGRAQQTSFLDLEGEELKFDTILLLMNGIGVAGTVAALPFFLHHAYRLTTQNGQILVDSSDLRNTVLEKENESGYFGEVRFQLEYKNQMGEWYDWLYLDPELLDKTAKDCGWKTEIIIQQDDDTYLARLTKL